MKSTKLTLAIMLMASIGAHAQVHRFVGHRADIMHTAMPNMREVMAPPVQRAQIPQPAIQSVNPVNQSTLNQGINRTLDRAPAIQSFHGSVYISTGVSESGVISRLYGPFIVDPSTIDSLIKPVSQ